MSDHTCFQEQWYFPQVTCQYRCFIRSSRHQCTHSRAESVSRCLKTGRGGIQKGEIILICRTGQQSLWEWFRSCLSERCHRDRTGRMESGCVRVSILSTTIESLLRLLSACWLAALHPKMSVFSLPWLFWLVSYIITFEDECMRKHWPSSVLLNSYQAIKHWFYAHLISPGCSHSLCPKSSLPCSYSIYS